MKTKAGALNQGWVRCHDCGHLSHLNVHSCPVCNSILHPRTPNSVGRTAALVLSSYALYIPANMFPIMSFTQFGKEELHTIIGGIFSLIEKGLMPVALLVLVASILVPLLKLLGLTLLLLFTYFRWPIKARFWTVVYRIIAFVGRWSMLDIFMIAILVSLVNMGGVAKVLAGPAAIAFSSVVVLTMFAAISFDPRLIWDNPNAYE
jgi:paraquat-inducible protein A